MWDKNSLVQNLDLRERRRLNRITTTTTITMIMMIKTKAPAATPAITATDEKTPKHKTG